MFASIYSDEVIILSAVGTAAKINLNFDLTQLPVTSGPGSQAPATPTLAAVATDKDMHGGAEKERDKEKYLFVDTGLANQGHIKTIGTAEGCVSWLHIPSLHLSQFIVYHGYI